jgi:hypothetical protein
MLEEHGGVLGIERDVAFSEDDSLSCSEDDSVDLHIVEDYSSDEAQNFEASNNSSPMSRSVLKETGKMDKVLPGMESLIALSVSSRINAQVQNYSLNSYPFSWDQLMGASKE